MSKVKAKKEGSLSVSLLSQRFAIANSASAVMEVSAAPKTGTPARNLVMPIGINSAVRTLPLPKGSYFVRLMFPNGDTRSERVDVQTGKKTSLALDLERFFRVDSTSHAMRPVKHKHVGLGHKQVELLAGKALRQVKPATKTHADKVNRVPDVVVLQKPILQTTFLDRQARFPSPFPRTEGWRWATTVDKKRRVPTGRPSPRELVQWWTGAPVCDPERLTAQRAGTSAYVLRSTLPSARHVPHALQTPVRTFAAVRDPDGSSYYVVLPEGWRATPFHAAPRDVDAFVSLRSASLRPSSAFRSKAINPWKCSAQIADSDDMSLLGFLNSEQAQASQAILEQAHNWLFGKFENPIAAAAGALMLLSNTEEANQRLSPAWRQWVRNLYQWFPYLPDGAIAMAQLQLTHGEHEGSPINVEKLRDYAHEAVHRGLPFLGIGVRRLTDVLIALEGDDRANDREGPRVNATRGALEMVRQLGRITVPGEIFTVLRLDEAV